MYIEIQPRHKDVVDQITIQNDRSYTLTTYYDIVTKTTVVWEYVVYICWTGMCWFSKKFNPHKHRDTITTGVSMYIL